MHRLAAIILLAPTVFSQNVADPEVARAAKSPVEFARYVETHIRFAWEPLWTALGIKDPGFIRECGWSGDAHGCTVESIRVTEPDLAIVILSAEFPRDELCVRFQRERSGDWRATSSYGIFIWNNDPRHTLFRVGSKPFLKVSEQGIRGSAIGSELEVWFDLTQPELEPVFSDTIKGYKFQFGAGVSVDINSHAIPRIEDSAEAIDVTTQVRFYGPDIELGSAEFRAVYGRGLDEKGFSPRRAYLGDKLIPVQDFEAVSDISDDSPPNELLLIYALPRLKEVASGSDPEAKDWLHEVLTHCLDTPEKRMLADLLGH